MKECPKCGTVYTDLTLSYCLSDGTPLVEQINGEKTEKFSNLVVDVNTAETIASETRQSNLPTAETVVQTRGKPARKGASPFWIVATFGLLGLILFGGLAFWILSNRSSGTDSDLTGTNSTDETSLNSAPPEQQTNTTSNSFSTNTSSTPKTSATPKPTAAAITKPTPKKNTYRVSGVRSNDVLYIRPHPGNLKISVGKIPPNATGIRIVGGGKKVGKSRWVPIIYKGKRGWINSRFISRVK